MTNNFQPNKGMRDFYPEDQQIFNYIFNNIKEVVELFGFKQYNAPMIESEELYLSKTSDEIVNQQTYAFIDRGNRKVVIRPEMTPSLARMVASRQKALNYPLRWYSIPNLLRYERPQNSRFREHWQLNVDIFGESTVLAEIELLSLVNNIFLKFEANPKDFKIRINSRKLLELLLEDINVENKDYLQIFRVIDRKNKISESEFKNELSEIINNQANVDKLISFLNIKNINDIEAKFKSSSSFKNLKEIFSVLKLENLVYDSSIIRGFDYYTDIVFEVTDNDPNNNRSVMGGGRYDNLTEAIGGDPMPIIGFGLGDASFHNFLTAHKLLPKIDNNDTVAVLLIGDLYKESIDLIEQLRKNNIKTVVNFSDAKIGHKIKWALKENIRYVVIVGESELKEAKFNFKDLLSSKEDHLSIQEIIKNLKK